MSFLCGEPLVYTDDKIHVLVMLAIVVVAVCVCVCVYVCYCANVYTHER